ncbi:hypothetical protein [Paracraurococcus lichenis]|uniref:Uncharacterized protein n=1 Tax=Paracraurococcus lichenis TaxID=3064888 RepID=A0ABT9DSF8_9PROT|nr:hypothetical protein [Paracraurococcus sp. LOR1-02]MDO9706832.1 hypothetical protein [Paracraurococcus sp. LOR1-02]
MTAAAVLGTLLQEALPETPVLDLGLPAGRIFPWWPGARCGVADAEALPPAEAALLRRFRLGGAGLGVLGLDGTAGLDQAAGAFRLLVLDGLPRRLPAALEAGDIMVLQRGGSEGQAPLPGPERGRIMLLGGSTGRIERWDLLVPRDAVGALFDRLHVAAHRLAARLGGHARWQVGGRVAQRQLASLGILATGPERMPPLVLPAKALWHDLPGLLQGDALPLGSARQARILLGALPDLPSRLGLKLGGADPAQPPALFLDGLPLATRSATEEGVLVLEALARFRPDRAGVVGLALPAAAPPGLAILGLEVAP